MTIPPPFLAAAVTAARPARDFDARPLTLTEQRDLATLYVVGYTPEQAGEWLTSGRVRARAQGVTP